MEKELAIEAWAYGDELVLEAYRYSPSPAAQDEVHSHEQYQLYLSLDFPGEYRYQGESHPVPAGSLSIIHPGEVHYSRDPHDRETYAHYRLAYVKPGMLAETAAEVAGYASGLPFFPAPILRDKVLAADFLKLHVALETDTSRLEKDSRLLDMLVQFIRRHAEKRPSLRAVGKERRAVKRGFLRPEPLWPALQARGGRIARKLRQGGSLESEILRTVDSLDWRCSKRDSKNVHYGSARRFYTSVAVTSNRGAPDG